MPSSAHPTLQFNGREVTQIVHKSSSCKEANTRTILVDGVIQRSLQRIRSRTAEATVEAVADTERDGKQHSKSLPRQRQQSCRQHKRQAESTSVYLRVLGAATWPRG